MRLRRFHLRFFTLLALANLLAGCNTKQESTRAVGQDDSNLVIEQTLNQPADPANQITTDANSMAEGNQVVTTEKQIADDVVNRLETSYARLAAEQNDVCPKLLEFQFSTQSLVRNNERLMQQTCEYYVYLNAGERLRVTNSEGMRAELVSPVWFDFRNGEFKAPSFDRYTIRMSYNGTRYNPQNFVYDVILTKNPTH